MEIWIFWNSPFFRFRFLFSEIRKYFDYVKKLILEIKNLNFWVNYTLKMSLFKTRDLWSTYCDNDLFDLGCLKVANLGVNRKNFTSIITGSYNGFLRVYNPSKDNTGGEAKAHDLICELSFPNPILQIETGRFVR